MRKILVLIASVLLSCAAHAQNLAGTYMVAERDTCTLYLDHYTPAPGTDKLADGSAKPTILYVFGGGFISGRRNDPFLMPWIKILNDNGYGVVSVDYRLGLKGAKMGFGLFQLINSAKLTKRAVDIGVEDVFASVRFIADNAAEMGIDPNNIVIAGSSAGAMIALSSELETCNGSERTAVLPQGFRFKGVMSFAGAIMSDTGLPKYKAAPGPQLLFHGTEDRVANYNKTAFGRYGIFGSKSLVEKVLAKNGYTYCFYRYTGHYHDMASNLVPTWPLQKEFLETNVIKGIARTVDATVDDPKMPVWKPFTLDDLYKK